ncbi:MAG: type II secretion system F family protein [Mycobacteriales bacterium]
MTPAAAGAACATAAAVCCALGGRSPAERLRAALTGVRGPADPRPGSVGPAQHHWLERGALALGAAGAFALVGGPVGVVVAAATAVALRLFFARAEPRAARDRRTAAERQLPLLADLLSAAISAGNGATDVLPRVAHALGPPVDDVLVRVGHALALGTPARDAWEPLVVCTAAAASLVRAVVRSTEVGSSLAPALDAIAAELRRSRQVAGEAAARRAGVIAVLPLGLCFLPAFVLLTVVPLVSGLFLAGVVG